MKRLLRMKREGGGPLRSKEKPLTAAQTEALRRLWEQYHRFMLFIANRMMEKSEDADDVVQDVLLKLSRQIDRLSELPDAETKRYLAVSIRHEAINRGTYLQRRTSAVTDIDEAKLEQIPDTKDTEHMVMLRNDAERVLAIIRSLPEKEQAALRMKRIGGASDREIAGVLGIAESSVAQYVRRAQQKVAARFGRKEEGS